MIEIARVSNARVYIDGTDFVAKAEEVDLPRIKFKTADAKGLGMYGEFETVVGLDKAEAKIKFNSVYPEFISLASDPFTTRTVIIRAPYQVESQRGVERTASLKAEVRGKFKEFDTAKFKRAESAEAEATLSVIYYRLELDGQEIVEVDWMNNIYKINGVDILNNYRTAIGG